jgi:two-component system sensor histidine kinase TctE
LKTPLAGLRMQAELAQRDIDAGRSEPADIKRSLRQIALSSERAAHMVNQLLSMARSEDRDHTIALVPVDLAELAVETVQDFVPRALEKRIDLGYEGPEVATPDSGVAAAPVGLKVWGHRMLLGELIRNLVDNALHYTPTGGVVTVRVIDDPFSQTVTIQVEDSGPGIPLAEREQVFRPFYRLLGTQVDGSGLGLAIVRQIANQHSAELLIADANLPPREHPGDPADAAFGPGVQFTLRFAAVREVPADDGAPTLAGNVPGER